MTNDTTAGVEDSGAATGMAPAERVRALNDELRKTGAGGNTYLTPGLIAKGADFIVKATAAVRAFDAFTDDNDPWQEHDCATVDVDGERVMFKIDLYESQLVKRSSIAEPLSVSCRASQSVDFGSFGRGHALQRIDLYPVRAQTPSSHNQYSRMPRARKRRWQTKLLLGCEQPSIFPVANRLTAGAASPLIPSQTLSVAPSGTTPSSTKRQSAIASFLASATIPTLRPRIPLSPKRWRHHSESLLLGW